MMKTVGIAILFCLCSVIGMRLASKKTARLHAIRTLERELRLFSERIASGRGMLTEIAKEQGLLPEMLSEYLHALADGVRQTEAAEQAANRMNGKDTENAGVRMFFTDLSAASRADLRKRAETLSRTLECAEREADAEAKQARVLRLSGVLIGAGLAILLL